MTARAAPRDMVLSSSSGAFVFCAKFSDCSAAAIVLRRGGS